MINIQQKEEIKKKTAIVIDVAKNYFKKWRITKQRIKNIYSI